jgi:succinoglycan biosynthesis protein ExoV
LKLYYYRDPIGNFGDDLNPWLWPRIFPEPLDDYFDQDTLFLGIGSILNHKVPQIPRKKIVFGSGFGYGSTPKITEDWRFYCVRGPLTARALGLPESLAICDSSILVKKLFGHSIKKEHQVSFMPHHTVAEYDNWKSVCESISVGYIDPAADVEITIDQIRKSSLVISEALHGAIIADAFRVPWIPVRTRPRIVEFKWQDWARSLGMEHHFEWLPPVWSEDIDKRWKQLLHPFISRVARARMLWLIKYGKRRLSSELVFNRVYERLSQEFDRLITETCMP